MLENALKASKFWFSVVNGSFSEKYSLGAPELFSPVRSNFPINRLRGRLAILWPHYKHLRHFYMGDPPPSCMGKSFVPWQLYIQGRIQGEGAGVAHPPPPEMPCGFLIQLVWVFCINICLRHQSVTPFLSGAPCPKKNRGSPLISFVREARRRRIGRASSSHIISQTM